MTRPSNQSITWWLVLDFIRRNLKAIVFALVLLAIPAAWATNEPVSSQMIDGEFVRWTVNTGNGPGSTWVLVDVPGDQTIAVTAWDGWQLPEPGSLVRIEEVTLRWYGAYYRIVP